MTREPVSNGDLPLEVDDIHVSYGDRHVLFGVSLEVRAGEIVALLGTNGAGKSTVLKTVSGLLRPSRGEVRFAGQQISGLPAERTAAMGIVQVPGGRGIFPDLSVEEHLRVGAYTLPARDVESAVASAYEAFPELRPLAARRGGLLSGGEQQMVALARAWTARPRLLLIDELSLGLAPKIVERLVLAVESFRAQGVGILLVEQSVNLAAGIAERAYFLEKGEVRFEGSPRQLLRRKDLVRAVFLATKR